MAKNTNKSQFWNNLIFVGIIFLLLAIASYALGYIFYMVSPSSLTALGWQLIILLSIIICASLFLVTGVILIILGIAMVSWGDKPEKVRLPFDERTST
jgi:membrane-bound ClpP family serine protease